jgi:hypothetical protein
MRRNKRNKTIVGLTDMGLKEVGKMLLVSFIGISWYIIFIMAVFSQ